MVNFGFIESKMDGSEYIFDAPATLDIPETYSYIPNLPPVLDQGAEPICVTCSVSAYLDWKEGLKTGNPVDNGIKRRDIYNSRTNQGDGMTYKDAFHYLRHHGVNSKVGNLKIGSYALIRNANALKYAIISNGPCFGATPVYGDDFIMNPEFWKKDNGDYCGGHAISIVGYTPEGFIIRNSWGTIYGKKGYEILKYQDYKSLLEVWTVVG